MSPTLIIVGISDVSPQSTISCEIFDIAADSVATALSTMPWHLVAALVALVSLVAALVSDVLALDSLVADAVSLAFDATSDAFALVSDVFALDLLFADAISDAFASNAHVLDDCVLPVLLSVSATSSGELVDSAHAFALDCDDADAVSLDFALVSDVLALVLLVAALVSDVFAAVSLALALVSLVAALVSDVDAAFALFCAIV